MEIVLGRSYAIVVEFPWGERLEMVSDRVVRQADGSIRWTPPGEFAFEPCLDPVIQETEDRVLGWGGGCCDVTVVISAVEEPPGPTGRRPQR